MQYSEHFLGKRILLWFLMLCLFMSIIAYAVYLSISNYAEQTRWVSHTQEVIIEIGEAISQLKDVQIAQRGYVVTGDKNYLEPYNIAVPLLTESLKRLYSLVIDNPDQIARLKELETDAKKRVLIAENIIHIYNNEGQQAAFNKIKTGAGKKEMDAARQLAHEMIVEEKLLLDVRRKEAFSAITVTLTVCGAALLSCFAILGLIFNMMRREIIQRGKIQTEMKQLHYYTLMTSKLGELLQSCQNMEEASSILKNHMSVLLPNTQGAVALINNSRNQLEIILQWGEPLSELVTDFAPDECWALRSGKTHMVTKDNLTPICSHISQPANTSLCMPMMAHGETIGMLYIAFAEVKELSETVQSQIRTITEQAALALSNLKLQETLKMQSIKDPLTQLFNRRYMEVTLEREISRAKRNKQSIGVIMIDLDHFKRINDTYGHDAGDMVLKEFAALIKRTIRDEDIACRYGGEEFIIIIPNVTKEMIKERAENLRQNMSQLIISFRHQLLGPFTLSAGIAIYPGHGTTGDAIVTIADSALYKAKKNRDCVIIANE